RYAIVEAEIAPIDPDRAPVTWPETIGWIVHSSGSTGLPKAVPLTVEAVAKNAADTMEILGLPGAIRHYGCASHCYTNGLYNSFLVPLLTGGAAMVHPVASALTLRRWIAGAIRHRAELLWVNPTVVRLLIRGSGRQALPDARLFVSCTAPLGAEEALLAEARFGRPVLQSWGLSETLITTIEQPDRDAGTEFSCGLPLGGAAAVRVEDGALVIENGAVMPGYAAVEGDRPIFSFPNGIPSRVFVTEDLGEIDAGGRVRITGRSSATANIQGEKLSLAQIEASLRDLVGVTKAIAVAVPDPSSGERVAILLRSDSRVTSDAVADHIASRIGPRARPTSVRVVETLPLTANGKPDRIKARAVALVLLGLGA
ncbi:MAG: long-chain fatty acid--CoA ligase, partial [Alphaproteobacteria bacterium]|nr:long-chain fatty acid--CoA ligase [Alphaproteobacteria bacterium]